MEVVLPSRTKTIRRLRLAANSPAALALAETPEELMLAQAPLDPDLNLRPKTQFLTLPSGDRAVLKTKGPLITKNFYKHERAAYLASRIIGLDIVPPTVMRVHRGVKTSLQLAVEGCTAWESYLEIRDQGYRQSHAHQLAIMGLFDIAIWNRDRNQGNFLLDEGGLWAIDHELAFQRSHQPRLENPAIYDTDIPEAASEPFVRISCRAGKAKNPGKSHASPNRPQTNGGIRWPSGGYRHYAFGEWPGTPNQFFGGSLIFAQASLVSRLAVFGLDLFLTLLEPGFLSERS